MYQLMWMVLLVRTRWSQGRETKFTCSFLILSQTFGMLRTTAVLLFLAVGAADALYKQWIPDTNYENKTNWDKGDVPCGNDIVEFSAQRKVSVFVETMHAIQEMRLPIDGEFILDSGAGFYANSGQDPGCGAGLTVRFKDSESLRWFNPALWQAAASSDDLQSGNFLFSVHEESVPCRHDDVIFKTRSSFRVDTSSSHSIVNVKSVSVLGKTFGSQAEFSQYLRSRSGQLQFHGTSAVTVGEPGCSDPSGCDCGNSENHQLICSFVKCPSVSCTRPLLPVGHCCDVCGAIVSIQYTSGFNLQSYRQRIHHLFLVLPKYKSIKLGMSKVFKSQRFMFIPFDTSPEIQVVILDGEGESQSESLAWDIVKDARAQSSHLGITAADFQTSSGNSGGESGNNAGMVVGVVFGVLTMITLVLVLGLLVRKGVVRLPPLPSLSRLRRSSVVGELGGPLDQGYDNPMFNKPTMLPDVPSLYGGEITNSICLKQTGVHFVNPVYDEHESDFTA